MSNARNTDGEIIDNDNKRSLDGAKTTSGDRIINHGDGITEGIRGGGSGSTKPANAKS